MRTGRVLVFLVFAVYGQTLFKRAFARFVHLFLYFDIIRGSAYIWKLHTSLQRLLLSVPKMVAVERFSCTAKFALFRPLERLEKVLDRSVAKLT